jgi:hypothetical protein
MEITRLEEILQENLKPYHLDLTEGTYSKILYEKILQAIMQ